METPDNFTLAPHPRYTPEFEADVTSHIAHMEWLRAVRQNEREVQQRDAAAGRTGSRIVSFVVPNTVGFRD